MAVLKKEWGILGQGTVIKQIKYLRGFEEYKNSQWVQLCVLTGTEYVSLRNSGDSRDSRDLRNLKKNLKIDNFKKFEKFDKFKKFQEFKNSSNSRNFWNFL